MKTNFLIATWAAGTGTKRSLALFRRASTAQADRQTVATLFPMDKIGVMENWRIGAASSRPPLLVSRSISTLQPKQPTNAPRSIHKSEHIEGQSLSKQIQYALPLSFPPVQEGRLLHLNRSLEAAGTDNCSSEFGFADVLFQSAPIHHSLTAS